MVDYVHARRRLTAIAMPQQSVKASRRRRLERSQARRSAARIVVNAQLWPLTRRPRFNSTPFAERAAWS